jgi:filamentous hemagglutinin
VAPAIPTAGYSLFTNVWARAGAVIQTLGSLLCGDGDCTNEVQSTSSSVQSVWKLPTFLRGVKIEMMIGRSPQLAQNFPVIDRWQNGMATSIKSLDLGAKSYQNIATLTRTVQGYVNTLANWQGARWGGVTVDPTMITTREVLLAVPPGASQAQQNALNQLQQWASGLSVNLNIVVVP